MAEEIGIVMSLYDKVSPTLKAIGNNTKAFDKNLQELEQACKAYEKSQESLVKDISTLKSKLTESNDKVKEATKAWKANKSELTKGMLDKAISEQEEYKSKLKDTEAALNSQRKAVVNLADETRKVANAGGAAGGGGGSLAGLGNGLLSAGLGKMASDAVSQLAGAVLTSAIGEPNAQLASSTASGLISGATMGMIAGPMGAAIGAVVGGLSGLVSGGTQIFQAQDDSFKSYVQEQTEGQLTQRDSDIQSGSAIAAGREQKQLAFSTLLGSDGAAADFLGEVKAMAAGTNYTYDEITGYAKSMVKPFGAERSLEILGTLSDASAALSLNESDNAVLIAGLSRMKLTDKTTQEYLNYFSERGVDVYAALSKWGDAAAVAGKVSGGKIKGSEAADAILDYMQEQYGGLSQRMAGTYQGMMGNLEDARANAQEAYGLGYNEARKEGIRAETDWLGSGAMDEANKAIGAWQASLENSKEQFIRDAQKAVLESDAYKEAMALGTDEGYAEAGKLLMQAKVKGQSEYNASEGAQLALESELSLAAAIRDDARSNSAFYDAGYRKSQEYSKGLAAGMLHWDEEAYAEALGIEPKTGETAQEIHVSSGSWLESWNARMQKENDELVDQMGWRPNAYGLKRVPYDNFPALLHEGERVLTAQQARAQDGGGPGGVTVTVTGNSFVGTGEEMADQLMRVIAAKVRRAGLLAEP